MSIQKSTRQRHVALLFLALVGSLLSVSSLLADVTISYKSDFKMGALLPPSVLHQMGNARPTAILPPMSMRQVKGDKEHSTMGGRETLVDFTKQQITMLDATDKLYATAYMKDYLAELKASMPAMPALPPQAMAILQTMKTDFSTRKTGRTDMILGVPVEESEWTLTLKLPTDGLPLPPGTLPPGETLTIMRMVAQMWTVSPDATTHNAAIAELVAHQASISGGLVNPTGAIMEALAGFPGLREGLAPMMQELSKHPSVIMKSHITLYLPVVAQLAPIAVAHGQKLPLDFDPDAPLGEMTMEATGLSTAPIDDSVFVVPADYQPTSVADLMKAMRPAIVAQSSRPANPPPHP